MRRVLSVFLPIFCFAALLSAQTAEELIAKNIQAKGGLEKIKAIKTVRINGKQRGSDFEAEIGWEAKRPNLLRQTFTLQRMTEIQAYDGSTGWQIQPFEGRKDPDFMSEDDLRELVEDADFDGPLVDYKEKGNTVEFLGHDLVDGDDALKLKVTLKNSDIIYYYLDPDTYLEIQRERHQFIRGAVRETITELGSYKEVAGVFYPFSLETGPKGRPQDRQKIAIEKIEVNVPIEDSQFRMPAAAAAKPVAAKKD